MYFLLAVVGLLLYSGVLPPFFGGALMCCAIQLIVRALNNSDDSVVKPPKRNAPQSLVTVVGNIGAGKSTALKRFQRDLEDDAKSDISKFTACVCEPVDAWAPLLQELPESKTAWVELQVTIASWYASLSAEFENAEETRVAVCERDLMSVALFGGRNGAVASALLAFADCGAARIPEVAVYLATPWEECFSRITEAKREQAGDVHAANLGPEYFCELAGRHNTLMEWYASHGCCVISTSNADAAPIGLREAAAHALDCQQLPEFAPKIVTRAMMEDLLDRLWPTLMVE